MTSVEDMRFCAELAVLISVKWCIVGKLSVLDKHSMQSMKKIGQEASVEQQILHMHSKPFLVLHVCRKLLQMSTSF